MPSTRWLLLAVIAVYSTPWIKSAIAAEIPDALPVASNGWRPIIGTHEVKSYISVEQPKHSVNGHNKQTVSLTGDKHDNQNDKNKHTTQNQKGSNGGNQVHVSHHGSTGHRNKLQPPPTKQLYKPSGHGPIHVVTGKPALRHPVMNKLHAHMAHSAGNKRHKPNNKPQTRPQHPSSLRDEIMAPAPSSAIGSYAYFNQGPLHIQNAALGNKPYHSQSHIDFSNHFAFSNVNVDPVAPQQHFSTVPKHPSQNELHSNPYVFFNQNDDFTRNLVPPPPFYKPQGEREIIKEIPKHVEQQSATLNNAQIVHGKIREETKHGPSNLLGQLQPGYNHFQHQSAGKPSTEFEITKENFMEYHTTLAPVNYKPTTDSYLGVSKFTKPKILFTKASVPTYQVTEEKEWAEHLPAFKPLYSTLNPLVSVSKPYKTQFSTAVPEVQKYAFQQPHQQQPHPQQHHQQQHQQHHQQQHHQQQHHQQQHHQQQHHQQQHHQQQQHQTQQVVIPQDPSIGQFLPTPYNPEGTFPTSATQTDISTIYSEVSQINRKKSKNPFAHLQTPDPTRYNIKEVATHFPIFEENKPDTQISIPVDQKPLLEYENEVTTKKPEILETENTIEYVKPTQQTTFPTRGTSSIKRRPGHRRRRPTRPTTTTTTEAYEPPSEDIYTNHRTQESETERSTEKPYHHHRRRRPTKYRTTESPQTELVTISEPTTRATYYVRSKPQRGHPQTITEEVFATTQAHRRKQHKHHKYEQEENYPQQEYEQDFSTRQQTRLARPKENYGQQSTYGTPEEPTTQYQYVESETPTTEYVRSYTDYKYQEESIPETTDQAPRIKQKRRRPRPPITTTEILPTTNIKVPENELDYTTIAAEEEPFEETATIREVHDFEVERDPTTVLAATTAEVTSPTTTTTTEPSTTTTKANRIRQRPMKYDVQRPRFSVKDYRQRLSQYMSTSTSTEVAKPSSETPRIRYPTRFKLPSTNVDEESTEPVRQKFIPKDPRHKLPSTESNVEANYSSTEKYLRGISNRIRPFGRLRLTTESPPTSTTTQRVSIKPNIFNNLKRPQQINLRNRILNKKRNQSQSTTESIQIEPESNELVTNTEKTEVTLQFESAESKIEVTTQLYRDLEGTNVEKTTQPTRPNTYKSNDVDLQDDEIVTPDEAEAFLQLQRISDLTSSAHRQYNTPGMFKSVSPTSRRVPSYFTIATEDPILPIEAFFPNLNHKSK